MLSMASVRADQPGEASPSLAEPLDPRTGGFVVVHVDSLQLEITLPSVRSRRIYTMFIGDHLSYHAGEPLAISRAVKVGPGDGTPSNEHFRWRRVRAQ